MAKPSNKQLADAFRLMCRYAMTVIIDAESKEATAVFYGGKLATEPCVTPSDAPDAACRAIARCAGMAEKMIAAPGVAVVDPADPGYDVTVLREHVRHLERRIRELHAERNAGVNPCDRGQSSEGFNAG